MADAPVSKERIMKFPYTITAKMMAFPYKHHYKHAWITKWWLIGIVCTAPLFIKISNAVNSPENVAKWAEIRRKQYAGESH